MGIMRKSPGNRKRKARAARSEPFVEDLVDSAVFRDMNRAVREYLEDKFDCDKDMIEAVWDGQRKVRLYDPQGSMVAVISMKDDQISVYHMATPWAVARKNSRLGFSCAIGERIQHDNSPAGKLCAARSESGGVCSTN